MKTNVSGRAAPGIFLVLQLLFCPHAPAQGSGCASAPDGLVSWWRAEGNALDAWGANAGTLMNGAGFTDGKVGQTFSFDGVNDYVKIPKAPALEVGNQVTIEFWMKADPANAMNTYQGLVTSDFFGIEIANGYVLGPLGVEFFISTDGGASVSPSSYPDTATVNGGGAVVTAGQWHHVAGTYDGAKLQLYIDGQPWGNPNYHSGAISPMLANSFVAIGSEDGRTICPDCVSNRYFKGLIDEPSIYNRALSAGEILSIYNAGSAGKCVPLNPTNNCVTPPPGLVSWWRSENNPNDSAGGNHGILRNGPTFAGGKAGNAFSFSGANDCVEIPYSASLVPTNFTVEAWVKPSAQISDSIGQDLIFGQGYGHGQLVVRTGTTGVRVAWEFGTSPFNFPEVSGSTEIPIGQFSHLVGTWNGATLRLYINGVLNAQSTPGAVPVDSGCPFFIGGFYSPGENSCSYVGQFFNGLIDEVSLYSRALADSEILSIYTAGSAGKCAPATLTCVTPPSGLVGWWPAEGNVNDVAGADNGTLQGGAVFASGKVGQGFRFDGTNGYVQIPDSNALKPANVTCEAWVWLDPSLPAGRGGEQIVFKKNTWSAWFEGYGLSKGTIDNGGGTYSDRFQFVVSRYGNQVVINSQTIAQRGVWYHVAATYDGSQSKLYVNGVLEASATPGFALDYDTTPIFIGTSGTWAPYLSMFGGIIDEPSIYSRALSTSEIAAIYNAGSAGKCAPANTTNNCVTPPSGLAAWWRGEANANDSINGNPGSPVGALVYASGEAGQSFLFDGSTSYIPLPASPSLNIGTGSGVTIECWIQPNAFDVDVSGAPIIEWDSATTDGLQLWSGGNIFANIMDTSGNGHTFQSAAHLLDTNHFQHVALTYDKSSGQAAIYLNGNVVASANFGSITPQTTYPVNIGRRTGQPIGLNDTYGGLLDELSLYNRALSQSEIQAIYNAGSAGKCAPVATTNNCATAPSGLVAWWPGNGNTDELIHSNNGTLGGGASYTNALVGQGFNLDGLAGRVTAPNSPVLNFGPTQDLSIECWIKAYPNSNPSNVRSIVEKRNAAENYRGYTLFLWDGFLAFQLSDISHGINYFSFGADLRDGVFHHVAVSVQRNSSSGGHLYVDGQVIYTFDPTSIGDLSNSDVLRIGQHAAPGDPSYFPGVIDDVAIYNRALSTSEIQSIYAAGSAGKCALATPTTNCTPTPSGLVASWRAEGNAVDTVSGTAGTLENVSFTAGEVGQTFVFNPAGGQTRVVIPDQPAFALTHSLSIEGWIRPTGPGWTIFWRGDNRGGLDPYFLQMNPDAGNILQFIVEQESPNTAAIIGTAPLAFNQWCHLAATLDDATGAMRIYTNGLLAAQTITSIRPFANLLAANEASLGIGNLGEHQFDHPFVGNIDELSLYSRALSQSEVQAIYNAGSAGKCAPTVATNNCIPAPSGIVGWWKSDGNALDSVGNNNGVLQNVTFNAGEVRQAFAFNDINAAVVVPASPNLNVGSGAGLTVEAWINPADVTQAHPLFEWNNSTYWGVHFYIAPGQPTSGSSGPAGSGQLYANIVDSSGGWHQMGSSAGVVAANVFQHVALTYDKASGVATIYRNGQIVSQLTLGSFTPLTTYDLFLGRRQAPSAEAGSFVGLMDEPAIYNRALSINEIQSIYNAGSAGKCAPLNSGVPAITSLSPAAGTNGTVVTISGANFNPTPGHNLVYFGAVRANVLTATATSLSVLVPPGATFAPPTVTVDGLTAWAGTSFLPTFSGAGTITSASLAPRVDLAAGNNPYNSILADMDGDGKPDVVVANIFGNSVSIYRNISTQGLLTASSFAPRIELPTSAGAYSPVGMAVADVDGDGKFDIVTTDYNNNLVSVFRNLSTPGNLTTNTFAPRVDLATASGPQGVDVKDLDGDGRPELLVANVGDGTLSIFRNIGAVGNIAAGSFAPKVDVVTGNGCDAVATGDLDGDGKPDVVAINSGGGTLSLLRNLSSPGSLGVNSFAPKLDLVVPDGPQRVAIGDLDGDGKPDLSLTCYLSQTLSLFRNTSTAGSLTAGSFAPRIDYALGGRGHTPAIADIDGDGKPDLAVVTELNSLLSIFRNVSTPGNLNATSLAPRVDLGTGWNAWGVAAGDLDGDGRPDLVFCNQYDSTISIYQNIAPFGGDPVILTQPADQTVTVGNSASFTALAGGQDPLSYQWQFNGTNIAAATNPWLKLFNVQPAQAGNYSVLVSNSFGGATSSNALLTIVPAVCIAPVTGLISWWKGQNDSLDIVTGNHATLQNGAGFAPAQVGTGFNLDGADDYLLVSDYPSLNVGNAGGITFECWLNPMSLDSSMLILEYERVLASFSGSDVGVQFAINVPPGSGSGPGSIVANLKDTTDADHIFSSPPNLVVAGVWQHVAWAYDRASGVATFYLNGAVVASANLGSFTPQTSFANLLIGARTTFNSVANPSDRFSGGLDELGLYDRALSASEIQAIYNAGTAGKCDVPVAPSIVAQPQDLATPYGTPALFNVVAGGTMPLSYQWLVNNTNIFNETNSTLMLANVQYNQSGNLYSVVITNTGGGVTSSNAVLTVINTAPQISGIGDQNVSYSAPPLALAFLVSDAESLADNLQITASSSNTNLVPNEQLVLSGAGTNRTITPTPITNLLGNTTITITVVDEGGASNQMSFSFTVINSLPNVSPITSFHAAANQPTAPIAFTVSDAETPADQLILTVLSSNSGVVPTNQIIFGGSGNNRTLTITPVQTGVAIITIRATDELGGGGAIFFQVTVDSFTQLPNNFPALTFSTVAWGDYDNDGRLDLLVAGTTNNQPSGAITRIYHNDGGVFTNFISLTSVFKCAAAWNDYDRDGRLDIVISGLTSSNLPLTRIYRNNGNGTFTDINAGLAPCYSGTVAWGDFNNDGAADIYLSGLVTTTNGAIPVTTNLMRLYRNDGGVFTDMNLNLLLADNRVAGPSLGTAAWGDYDNDGKLDLLLAGSVNGQAGIGSIYRNLGNGTFSNAFTASQASTFVFGAAAAWGDYDNDGWLDIAMAGVSSGGAIYRNNRNGTFSQISTLPAGNTPYLAWGDFDNDGDLDLVAGNSNATRVYRNTDGTFTDSQAGLAGQLNGAMAWGDFDNDGRLDIVLMGKSQPFFRNNNGSPNTPPAPPANLVSTLTASNTVIFTWSRPLDSQTASNGLNYNLRVGTNEGGIDMVSPLADPITGTRRVAAMGNASPTNRALLINLPKGKYYWSVQAIDTAFASSSFSGAPAALDATFTITNARPTISDIADQIIAPGTNAPGPALPFTIGDAETWPGDLTITVRSSNTNVVALTNMVVTRPPDNRQIPPTNCTIRVAARTNGISVITVTVADAQGAFASDTFTVRAEQFTLLSTNFVQVQNSFVAWGDYDNDGDLDVVMAGNTNGSTTLPPVTRLYRNDGNGVFTPVATSFPNVTLGSAAWGDYDNDGRLDLLITGSTNGNATSANGALSRIYHNNGDGTFTDIHAGLPGVFYSAVAWGDYDNDGRADVLITGTTNGFGTGTLSRIYRNNGDGTFSNAVTLPGIYQGSVAFGDFDGDGDLDLVLVGINANVVSGVFRNNGANSFTQAATLALLYNCSVAVGDADNDGRPDILLSGFNGNYSTLFYRNTGPFTFANFFIGSPGARYASAALGDFDNDGRLDILLSGTGNGLASGGFTRVFRNTGSFISQGIPSFSLVPTTLPTNFLGAVSWADFDNDGDLDLLVTGTDGVLNGQFTRSQTMLFRNNSTLSNTPPTAPITLAAARSNNVVSLTWAKSTDAQTRTIISKTAQITNYDGIKYQLRVGTLPGGIQTESPLADLSNGYRRVVRIGDASTNRWQLLNLPPGNYYWSVQAIDTEFAGSPFAPENSFVVSHLPTAIADSISTPMNTTTSFLAAKLTVNDLSPDGYALTVIGVSHFGTLGGTATLTADHIQYTPPSPTVTGNDTFSYTISDGVGGMAVGSFTVTVGNGGWIALNIVYGPVMEGGDFVVRFAGIPGFTYTIEAAASLNGPWQKVANQTAPTTDAGFGIGIFEFREPMGSNATRFYRTLFPAY